MSQRPYNPMVLAEMTRAVQAERPDADWHELEPLLRAAWERVPRMSDWEHVRDIAAAHYRLGLGIPDAAPVVTIGAGSLPGALP
ncbi:hypothetical protein CNR27_07680 [Luteimonas chenhongjianii]|uniref:Uncharacterized protein n=2 Tax=Luteimonas TaxID=83614 RepID=A0A290XE31_9GAMM|nr:hypothetical protein [Luteimonas chenhongjianii]ATD67331.1 hypothetical protein CNR27_07680 [Luteimonas chenhongjianii]RPD86566.1 hypothetical protein EGK76_07945 [Luteimonas sp. 100069]